MNLGLSALCSVAIIFLLLGNSNRILRPALILAVACCLIFQWPLALMSDALLTSLSNPWMFASFAHVPVLAGCAFVFATPTLDRQENNGDDRVFDLATAWPVAALLVVFVTIFLARVPLDCTALYASIFDPAAGLLAREVTIKFAGSVFATVSYGAVANSVSPAMVGLLLLMAMHFVRECRWLQALGCLLVIVPCVAVVLLGGAKGLLVPIFIVGLFAALSARGTLLLRTTAVVSTLAVLVITMVSFELARERNVEIGQYDFNSCTARLGSTNEGVELLRSMYDGGLGLPASRIRWYLVEAENEADGSIDISKPPTTFERPELSPQRAGSYLQSIIQRAFITPLQVASWHQLYVDEHGSPGREVLPLAKYLFGSSVDMTSEVYRSYGVIFSGGDRTSTSTAPTSFVFAYPAYFGWLGMLVVVSMIVALDAVMSWANRNLPRGNAFISAGLAAVICYNLLTSDFYTVMMSHGGGAAILTVLLMRLGQYLAHKHSDRRKTDLG